ncbi:MAG: SH3 domain-containing protein, partial [Mesorhizobium sp.]
KQRQAIRYSWCEVWHDPAQNGHFVTGWVYGKYIAPY